MHEEDRKDMKFWREEMPRGNLLSKILPKVSRQIGCHVEDLGSVWILELLWEKYAKLEVLHKVYVGIWYATKRLNRRIGIRLRRGESGVNNIFKVNTRKST